MWDIKNVSIDSLIISISTRQKFISPLCRTQFCVPWNCAEHLRTIHLRDATKLRRRRTCVPACYEHRVAVLHHWCFVCARCVAYTQVCASVAYNGLVSNWLRNPGARAAFNGDVNEAQALDFFPIHAISGYQYFFAAAVGYSCGGRKLYPLMTTRQRGDVMNRLSNDEITK